jgi:hypothetical protein
VAGGFRRLQSIAVNRHGQHIAVEPHLCVKQNTVGHYKASSARSSAFGAVEPCDLPINDLKALIESTKRQTEA